MLPPADSPIYTFMPMQEGQKAVAIIGTNGFFVFRGETPLEAKAKAKSYLVDSHAKIAAKKAKGRSSSTPPPEVAALEPAGGAE